MAINLSHFPKSQLGLWKGDLEKQWNSLEKRIRDHPFNHAVEVVIPGCASLEGIVSSTLPPYYTSHLSLSHFLKPELLTRYFLNGQTTPLALSVGTRIDLDDVFALLPHGKLILSVTKDTYEQLGLQGVQSRYQDHRYVVQVDLAAPYFKAGKPGFERVRQCLDRLQLQADFILTWDNQDAEAQSQFMVDFKAKRFDNSEERVPLTDFSFPVLEGGSPHGSHDDSGDATACSAEEAHTWLGGVACGLEGEGGAPGDYVSTFTPPEPLSTHQHGIRARWTGMLTSQYLCSMLKSIRNYLSTSSAGISQWAAVSVWGFEDAPVSWRTNEHGWFLSGENHYNVVLFGSGQYWIMTALATHDIL